MFLGPLLIDIPKSFIENNASLSGANILSKAIIKACIDYCDSIIILSDSDTTSLLQTPWLSHKNSKHIRSLTELEHLLAPPTLAFSTSVDISKLLQARNAFRFPCPVIGLIHSLGTPSVFTTLKHVFKHITENDGYICPSQATQTTLNQLALQCITEPQFHSKVIRHGIDITRFSPQSSHEKEWLRGYFKFNKTDTIILHVSRLNPYTKTDIFPMIKDLTPLLLNDHTLKLWIVGTNHLPHYMTMISNYIHTFNLETQVIIDVTPEHNAMEKYYQTADIFIYMADNRAETFGLSVAEAMSCGLPVVISDISGLSEIVEQDITGYIIPTISGSIGLDTPSNLGSSAEFGDKSIQGTAFSHHHFLKAITRLLDPELRHKMGTKSNQKCRDYLDFTQLIHQYFDYFKELQLSFKSVQWPDNDLQNIDTLLTHTTTHTLTAMTMLTITEKGNNTINDKHPFFCMSAHLESYPFMYSILTYMKESSSRSVNDVRHQYSCNPNWIDATILYMIKNDLLSWS